MTVVVFRDLAQLQRKCFILHTLVVVYNTHSLHPRTLRENSQAVGRMRGVVTVYDGVYHPVRCIPHSRSIPLG